MDEELLAKIRNDDASITHMNLEGTQLNRRCNKFEKFIEALKTNTTITHLNLKENSIDFDDILLIENALKYNKTITYVNLMNNWIESATVPHLIRMFETNGMLVRIDLNRIDMHYNMLSSGDIHLIKQCTQRNLNMHNNARQCIIQFLCIKKFRHHECVYLNQIDKNIVLVIVKEAWKTRGDFIWDFIDNKKRIKR